jgi:hypothetical protein
MKLPKRISVLFFIGIFAAGSTALGYFYYYVYSPPLKAAAEFMRAMESGDPEVLRGAIVMTSNNGDVGEVREATTDDAQYLLAEHFDRGRILDQRRREGKSRDFYYLVYREPDGVAAYALLVTRFGAGFRVVINDQAMGTPARYLWRFDWQN